MVITLPELEKEFGRLAVRSADLSPATAACGLMAVAEVKDRFGRQADSTGRPWAPLKYPRPEGGSLVLLNHGILRASYTSESGPDFFRVGTSDRRARLLHFGGVVRPVSRKWLTIPKTKEAVYAGKAPSQPGLHFRQKAGSPTAGLYDRAGTLHWLLVKQTVIPPRPQVGLSDELVDRVKKTVVTFILTGSL